MASTSQAASTSNTRGRPIPFPPPPPVESIPVTPELLEAALIPVIGAQLEQAGFTHIERGAVHWLEDTVVHLVQDIFEIAKERAEGAGRGRANVIDLWDVIEDEGLIRGGIEGLAEIVKARRGQPRTAVVRIDVQEPLPPAPTLDEIEGVDQPILLLPYAPQHAPPLPATHTYVFSRAPAQHQSTSLNTLNQQVEESRLAESSLRKLIKSLEDESDALRGSVPHSNGTPIGISRSGSEAALMPPPFGLPPLSVADMAPVVNWERGRMQGKRWNVKR